MSYANAGYDGPAYASGVNPSPVDPLTASPAVKLNYSDLATPTYLTRDIGLSDRIIYVKTTQGYPAAPFLICVDPGAATQEVCLVTSLDSVSFTVTRNYDGAGIFIHSAQSASVIHTTTSLDYSVLNHHVYDSTVDWHPRYLDVTRHSQRPHVFGGALGIPSSVSSSQPGDAGQVNPTGSTLAVPADHVHARESYGQVLAGSLIPGMRVMVNSARATSFSWLPPVSVASPNPYPSTTQQGPFDLSFISPMATGGMGYGVPQSHPLPTDPLVTFYQR